MANSKIRKKAGKLVNLETLLAPIRSQTPPPALVTLGGQTPRGPHRRQRPSPCQLQSAGGRVIHNGIIENFQRLRSELEQSGVVLESETDTEIVAHLIAHILPELNNDLPKAMQSVCSRLEGAFTLVVTDRDQPDLVVGARRNSPLVVGLGTDGNFLASDVAAFVEHTKMLLNSAKTKS